MPNQAGVLAPAQKLLEQAEAQFAAHDAGAAITTAQAASEQAKQLREQLQRYLALRAAIVQGRKDAEATRADGYNVDASHAELDKARDLLGQAAQSLQQGGAPQALFDQLQARLEDAHTYGPGLVGVRESNSERITTIEKRGEQVAELIVLGREQFDIVDEFAESSWSDIRGNGTEAQNAADQAQSFWESAKELNTMEAQGFIQARDELNQADSLLDKATALIDAIVKRLSDLQAARSAAQEELTSAQSDISIAEQYIRSNDPEISTEPDQRLAQARAYLQEAQAEAQQAKPNWLELVRLAQAANSEADTALSNARSEVEATRKLLEQIERARTIAQSEVEKIEQFVRIHNDDFNASQLQMIDALHRQAQLAQAGLQQSQQVEDFARRKKLEESYQAYTELQSQTQQVYQTLYAHFQQLDSWRKQLNQKREEAELTLNRAVALLNSQMVRSLYDEPTKLINDAKVLLNSVARGANNEAAIKKQIEVAHEAKVKAERALQLLRSANQHQSRGPIGPGPIIISGGGWGERRDRGSWSSGGGYSRPSRPSRPSSGGSSRTWGGGSRAGGSFGGGSRSGGGFGGGKRSGGGW
jgi:hypothetical protein